MAFTMVGVIEHTYVGTRKKLEGVIGRINQAFPAAKQLTMFQREGVVQ